MKRGDVYFVNLDPTQGAETKKTRPVILVSNDAANRAGALVTVVPITSNVTRIFPFEVALPVAQTGLRKDSKAMAQQVRTLDKARLAVRPSGHVPAPLMLLVDAALRLHLAL